MLKKNIGYTRRNASFNFKLVARLQGSLLMLESLFFLLCIFLSITAKRHRGRFACRLLSLWYLE